jgi:AraC family transcriptional activator of pobA
MKYIEFNKTLCKVKFHLNVIDLQSECANDLTSETQCAGFFQIYFIKNADGYLKLNDNRIDLKPNTIIFISQHQHYSWHIDSFSYQGHLLVFQDEFLNEFFSDQYFIFRLLYFYQTEHPLSIRLDESTFNNYLNKLKDIRTEIMETQSDSAHMIRSILYYILIALNRKYSDINKIGDAISVDNTAYQFRKLVEKNIQTSQRVDDYSSIMNVSRVSINKAVKSQFNTTASDFIKDRLLFEIKMRLIHTSKTVSEIAHEFNFPEINHLSRFFRNKMNLSPIEYRLSYLNENPS